MPADPTSRPAPRGHVWLVGMMGAGKSTVGRELAARLARPFVDTDARIEAETGRKVQAIFAEDGEPAFRAREAEMVRHVAIEPDAVIATGGGAPCHGGSFEVMERSGLVVWIDADVDEVLARTSVEHRPLLARGDARERWLSLLAARRGVYGRATLAIHRGPRESREVVAEIERFLDELGDGPLAIEPVPSVWVELGARRYAIRLDGRAGAETRLAAYVAHAQPPRRSALGLLTDENVARLHLPRVEAALRARGFRVVVHVVPAGEDHKTLAEAGRVAETFVRGGLDRRSAIVALGGGVVGDLGGFVAATLFRGVALIQAPTTLLAMVDASVGGKTAVNLESGKNLVGAFHQPKLVYADLGALATLSPRDLSAGLAECVKHALLEGGAHLDLLEREAERARRGDASVIAGLVASSCELKARVVAGDEREEQESSGRLLLNLGHTVGHALESHSHAGPRPTTPDDHPLRHGEAVALGLLAAARVGARIESDVAAEPGLEERIARLCARLGLPIDLDARLAEPRALDALAVDKKRASGRLRYIALPRPGAPRVVSLLPSRLAAILALAPPSTPVFASPPLPCSTPSDDPRR